MVKIELKEIDVDKIKPNPMQPREHFDRFKLKELSESIKEIGLINPITVRKKGKQFEIVAGERRWKAHQIAKKKKILTLSKEYSNEGQVAVESLIENVHRENLASIERAKFLKRIADIEKIYHIEDGKGFAIYKKGDINISALAKRVGMHIDTVRQDISLLGFEPSEVKDVQRRALVRIATVKDKKLKKQILNIAKRKERTTDEIDKIVSITRNADNNLKEALLSDEITTEQAERISKLESEPAREKAIQEHKDIKMVDKGVERNIEHQQTVKEKREFDKRLVQSKNWIASFRGSVTDSNRQLEKTIKILLISTKFIGIMDEKQKERLNYDVDRLIETLKRGIQLSEQIQEQI